MVMEYEDADDVSPDAQRLEVAFGAASDEVHDDVPDGFGSDRVLEDLTTRGWLRIRRGQVHEVGNDEALEGPIEIVEITAAGFSHARGAVASHDTVDNG